MKRHKAYVLVMIDKADPSYMWGYINHYKHKYPNTFHSKYVTLHRVGVEPNSVLNLLRRVTTQKDILLHLESIRKKAVKDFPDCYAVIARVGSKNCPISINWDKYYKIQNDKETKKKQYNILNFISKKNLMR